MHAKPAQVFLSYGRPDRDSARRLYTSLASAGVNVWFDEESIPPGAIWKSEIRRAIRDSRYFLALLSSNVTGRQGFVHSELRQAIEVLDEFPESDTFLVPARLDDCGVPIDRLGDLHWIDLFPDWRRGEEKLVRFFTASSVQMADYSAAERTVVSPTIRFDGVYQSSRVGDFWNYIRFYADGTAITVCSSGDPFQIEPWFKKDTKNTSFGKYTLEANKVRFISTSKEGSVEYAGEFRGEVLTVSVHSRINDHRSTIEYRFMPQS